MTSFSVPAVTILQSANGIFSVTMTYHEPLSDGEGSAAKDTPVETKKLMMMSVRIDAMRENK